MSFSIEKIKYETYFKIQVLKKVYIKSYYRNKVIDSFDETIIDQASKRQIRKLTKKFHALLRILIKGIIVEEEFKKIYNSAILLNLEIEQILHSKIKYRKLKKEKGRRAYKKLEDLFFCVNDLYPKTTSLTLIDHHLDIIGLFIFAIIFACLLREYVAAQYILHLLIYAVLILITIFSLPRFFRMINCLYRSSRIQRNKFEFSYQHKTINEDFLNQIILNKIKKL